MGLDPPFLGIETRFVERRSEVATREGEIVLGRYVQLAVFCYVLGRLDLKP